MNKSNKEFDLSNYSGNCNIYDQEKYKANSENNKTFNNTNGKSEIEDAIKINSFHDYDRIGKKILKILDEDYNSKSLDLSKVEIYSGTPISICPCCGDENIIKHGFFNGIQRYKCKKCNHTFSNASNSMWRYSKKEPSLWNAFVRMVFEQETLRNCSKMLGISLVTAFQWRHKILFALGKLNEVREFKGDVHMEAALFVANNKGNYTKNKPSYRREKNRLFRFLYSDKIEVIGIHSGENQIIIAPSEIIPNCYHKRINNKVSFEKEIISKINKNTYIKAYRSKTTANIAIKHDNKLPKRIKEEKGYEDKNIIKVISCSFYMKDNISDDEIIKNFKQNIKGFLYCYMGVATKYLQQYFNLVVHLIGALFTKRLSIGSIFKGLLSKGKYIKGNDIFAIDIF